MELLTTCTHQENDNGDYFVACVLTDTEARTIIGMLLTVRLLTDTLTSSIPLTVHQ